MSIVRAWPLILLSAGLYAACSSDAGVSSIGRHVEFSEESLVELPAHPLLHRVRDLQVDGSGRVWLVSADSPFISVVRPDDGDPVVFGTPGPGPEEMAAPWSVIPNGTGGAVIWDAGRRRVLEFGQEGGEVRFMSGTRIEIESYSVIRGLDATSYGTPLRMREAGSIVVFQPAHRPVLNTGDLRELVLLSGPSPAQIGDTLYAGPRRTESSAGEFLVPIPLWAACADGNVVVFEPPDRLISIRPALGTTDTTELTLSRRSIGDADIRRFLRYTIELELAGRTLPAEEVIERRIEQALRQGRDLFGTEAPVATNLLCDDSGRAWIQGFDPEAHPAGFGRDWWVVDTDRIVASVRFPRGFQPRAINRLGIYGTLRDSLDVERPYHLPTFSLPEHESRSEVSAELERLDRTARTAATPEEALATYRRIEEVATDADRPFTVMAARIGQGGAFLRMEELDSAELVLRDVVDRAANAGHDYNAAIAYDALATVFERRGSVDSAIVALRRAETRIERRGEADALLARIRERLASLTP